MKVKTANVMQHLNKHGSVKLKLDRACGLTQLVVTKRGKDDFVLGKTPGSTLTRHTEQVVIEQLDQLSIYVISWS